MIGYAKELKTRREAAGLTVRALGDLIGRSGTFVTDFELRKKSNPPDPETMRRLEDALGWAVSDQLRAWGYPLPDAPLSLVNPFDRDDMRFRVVEELKALDLNGPDAAFLRMYLRLKLRDLNDFRQYGVGDDDVADVLIDAESSSV